MSELKFGNWTNTKPLSYITSDSPDDGWDPESDLVHYNGHLVCESVRQPHVKRLLVAAPKLYRLAKSMVASHSVVEIDTFLNELDGIINEIEDIK